MGRVALLLALASGATLGVLGACSAFNGDGGDPTDVASDATTATGDTTAATTLDASVASDAPQTGDGSSSSSDAATAFLDASALWLTTGCSDTTREGFPFDVAIAACAGGWAVPGLLAPAGCKLAAGNTSANPFGTKCAAADLCTLGWHVCTSDMEVQTHSTGLTGCSNAAFYDPNDAGVFFATAQGSLGEGKCEASGGNDIFGCGTFGAEPDPSCNPLTKTSGDLCGEIDGAGQGWQCASGSDERDVVTKAGGPGGVLCCAD